MRETYVSTDVEADGPIPGPHSMLSLASAAFTEGGELVSSFSANLEPLEGAAGHPATLAWWQTNPEAWAATRRNLVPPREAMHQYLVWLKSLPGELVFVGYPAAYDFMFVTWYLLWFTGESPFGHAALDIRSYAMALLGTAYGGAAKRNLPGRWLPAAPHTHVALDDALEQGQLFCNMLADRTR